MISSETYIVFCDRIFRSAEIKDIILNENHEITLTQRRVVVHSGEPIQYIETETDFKEYFTTEENARERLSEIARLLNIVNRR